MSINKIDGEGQLRGTFGEAIAQQFGNEFPNTEVNKKGEVVPIRARHPRVENILNDMIDDLKKEEALPIRKRPNKKRRRGPRTLVLYK